MNYIPNIGSSMILGVTVYFCSWYMM